MTDLRIVGWRMAIILGCVAMATVITFVVTLAQDFYAPRYTAVAYLGINPMKKGTLRAGQPESAEAYLAALKATHAEMIKGERVLLRALDTPDLRRTAWYNRDPERALKRLGDVLSVRPAEKASLISVSITDVASSAQDRIDLAEIANAVAMAYVIDVRAAETGGRAEHMTRLREKLAELQEQSDTIRAEIARKKLPEVEFTQQQMKAQGARLVGLAAKGTELQLGKTQVEVSLIDLEKHVKAGTFAQMPEIRAMVDKQPDITALREREQDLRSKRAELVQKVGPKHASVVAIDASLAAVRKQLAQATKEAVPIQTMAFKEQLFLKLQTATTHLLSVKEQIARIHNTVQVDLQRNLVTMRHMQARQKTIAENVRRINDTLLQLELVMPGDRPVWLRAPATRPKKPVSSPRWLETVPLGALAGLAVGLILAFSLGLKPQER